MARLVTEMGSLPAKATVDEVCDRLVALSQHKYPIHEVTIRTDELVILYYVPEDLEGNPELPTVRDTIEGALSEIRMVESVPEKRRKLSKVGLELVDTMMADLWSRHLHAVGWVVGDRSRFCQFFGLDEFPDSFFDCPTHVVQSVNPDKLILLGSASRLYRTKQATLAICSTMVEA